LTDILVPYFKAGLENNEFCLWITSQPLVIEDAIEALRRVLPGLNVYREKRQIEFISYNDWFLTEGAFDPERVLNGWVEKLTYALNNGHDGLRLSGNTSWLEKENWDSFIKYKEQADIVIGNRQMIALCTYSIDRHTVAEIINLSVNHQFTLVKSEGEWEHIESTKRKIAEETAVRATKDWEHTFDTVPDLIAIIDTNYRVTRANSAMASKLRMTPEECIGLTCYSVVHGTTKPPSFCPHMQLLKDGFEHTAEVCEGCLGGYFIVSVSPLYDSERKVTGSIHVARDINERKQEEHRIHRYNCVLEEINRIFSNVVQAKTENELGNACLSVALEMTGSPVGFVGEVGIDGVMHDLAISEMGWDQCLMYDKTGHRRRPSNFVLHGLYGRVIESGKGFFTNDPLSHPDRIGLPEGHPPLTSFLGVPLVQEGKTVGILVVANREGGYNFEQQEDLEAIAPAVMQALQRKKAEQERKKAEEALQASENEFRTLAENSPDMIARFDRQNRHIYANPADAELYDRSPEEIIGKTHSELGMDPELVKFWREHSENVFITGKPKTMEFRYTSPLGKEYYFNTRIVPEFVNDDVNSVLAISRDITDIKETETKLKETLDNLENLVKERTAELEKAYKSLKESERSLAEAQKMAHIGNWEWDIVTDKVYWSDELYHIFGRNPQELAPDNNEFLNYVHPGNRDCVDNAFKNALNGEIYSIDYRIILADEEERVVHEQGEVIFEKNIPIRMIGTVQDITERKKAEEKIQSLANIVESSNDAIVTKSVDGIITSWNKGAEQFYGYSAEEIIGKPIFILEPSSSEGETKVLIKMVKQGERVHQYETTQLRKDGRKIYVSLSLSPILDIHGKLTAISVIARDITKRKEAEEALANVETARKKEIHHRIKNNLQVISSLLDLQAEKFNNRESIKYTEVLEAFRESQDRVISMALIHEELYKGGGLEKLDFSPYIEELAENLSHTCSFGNNDISLKLNLENNVFFDMDVAVPLGMIINELVSNSFKHAFSGRKEGEIQIKLHREGNGEYIISMNEKCKSTTFALTISDNGIGIPENLDIEELDSLGLQLVTSLVAQLDGELEIKGNNGTEFTIRFKVTDKDNQASAPVPQLIE
jgi:PAS domain S-box-containing protein